MFPAKSFIRQRFRPDVMIDSKGDRVGSPQAPTVAVGMRRDECGAANGVDGCHYIKRSSFYSCALLVQSVG
jgi:hypothetical protein